ncbi:uncharacterized protein PFL1_04151 [Pseudozyma flocculosa PF-1]|uniref:Related to nuclear GTPase n=2 Tax=Pseudozyma flocculosa TaxID=84751 RepID=A0A5C3ET02_9BASI|nr:uncharacterized protein PFL1_04151 [Pseudozyma flocculosa PF-1]EPQ28324.1 hypothetical protein PFL1_04151 [Pseudozyma flocculosa PF-1]SPO35474.1 related to nuclear GTPase [Pseudozyma flocculosa]
MKIRKRASKRLAVAQREKVKRKVREHHRKSRKEARKNPNPQWKSKLKKDPGIPNSYPYKEQLLAEIEDKRRRQEEERLEERERRRLEKANANKVDGDDDDEEADAMDVSALLGTSEDDDDDGPASPMVAPLFRGTLEELLGSDDIRTLVFAIDARDPQSYRSTWIEDEAHKRGKKLAIALGRADLVPAETLANWVAHLSKATGLQVFPISVRPELGREGMLGAEQLVEVLDLKGKGKGDVAVIGLGHSGRSSIADAILTAIGLPEGQKDLDEELTEWPAVLDTMPLVPVRKHDAVEDSEDDDEGEDDDEAVDREEDVEGQEDAADDDDDDDDEALAQQAEIRAMHTLMRNQGAVQRIKEPLPLVWALMSRISHPEDLMLIYNLPAFGSFTPSKASLADEELTEEERASLISAQLRAKVHADTEEFLISLARSQGALRRGKFPSTAAAARILLRHWSAHNFAYYSQAPALSAEDKLAYLEKVGRPRIQPLVEAAAAVPRKEFRKRWSAKELRLKPLSLVNGREALVVDEVRLMDPPYEEDDDESVGDEEEVEDDGEEEEEEAEGEDDETAEPALKSILKKPTSASTSGKGKKRSAPAASVTLVDGSVDVDDGDATIDDKDDSKLSRKDKRLAKKAKTTATPASTATANKKQKKPAGAAAATKAGAAGNALAASTGPAPGEKYDFTAFF